jgi:MOB kinase activator 1
VRTIFRRLFRVYAHIYSSHFDHICALGIEGSLITKILAGVTLRLLQAHLNTSYRHFFLFVTEVSRIASRSATCALVSFLQFDLVDKKELAPLDELNQAILIEDKIR